MSGPALCATRNLLGSDSTEIIDTVHAGARRWARSTGRFSCEGDAAAGRAKEQQLLAETLIEQISMGSTGA